jgi:hypothetical protein
VTTDYPSPDEIAELLAMQDEERALEASLMADPQGVVQPEPVEMCETWDEESEAA